MAFGFLKKENPGAARNKSPTFLYELTRLRIIVVRKDRNDTLKAAELSARPDAFCVNGSPTLLRGSRRLQSIGVDHQGFAF